MMSLRVVRVPLVSLMVVAASFGVARGENPVVEGVRTLIQNLLPPAGRGARPEVEAVIEVAPEQLNQFLPHLKKLLAAEMHFLRKICRPNAEQLAAIRAVGEEEIISIARQYVEMQRKNQHSGYPDARHLLAKALEQAVQKSMPDDVAARYAAEVTARERAHADAALGMMTVVIDRNLALSHEQFDQVHAAVAENYDPQWLRNLQLFLYEEYAPMPSEPTVGRLLSDRQREILKSRMNRGMIHFGWESDLGFQMWWGAVELKELDEYPEEVSP